jgi:methanethiol oxidase
MTRWTFDVIDPATSHALKAPPEDLAFVALDASNTRGGRDAIAIVDTRNGSPSFGRQVGQVEFPDAGNEVRRFGWSSPRSPSTSLRDNPRYLVVPGTQSSRIHIVDTWPDPRRPQLVKVIDKGEIARKTGYASPHTVRARAHGIFINALGGPDGDGPGGIFTLDPTSFEVQGAWESERGPQRLAHDFYWHLDEEVMITSE